MKKKGLILTVLATVMALGLVITGCSCSTSSSTDSSSKNQSATSKDANTTTANKTDANATTDNATATTNNASAKSSDIVGSWKYEKGSGANADYTVVYNADGTGKMINRLAGAEGAFTYTIDNGTVKMDFTDYPQAPSQPIPYVVEGNTLILKYNYGDVYHTKE